LTGEMSGCPGKGTIPDLFLGLELKLLLFIEFRVTFSFSSPKKTSSNSLKDALRLGDLFGKGTKGSRGEVLGPSEDRLCRSGVVSTWSKSIVLSCP